MLKLFVDTSAWLDLAKNVEGQPLIATLGTLVQEERLELLVPQVVLDEFERNRGRVTADMTRSTAAQWRRARQAIEEHGRGTGRQVALDELDSVVHREPLLQQLATRNFTEIAVLLKEGSRLEPSGEDIRRVVERALGGHAPFHRGKNSVADALLMEMYGSATQEPGADLDTRHCFVTHNTKDFSAVDNDDRLPHPDFASYFNSERSMYRTSITSALTVVFSAEFDELLEENHFPEEPRSLDEILRAEQHFFDLVWYQRSIEDMHPLGEAARRRLETAHGPDDLGPWTDFQWGMINGKLSTLRWVLGSEWDFLDT